MLKLINIIKKFEKNNFTSFYKTGVDMRDMFTRKLLNEVYNQNKKILTKEISNNLNFFFYYNSKIAREFLLNPSQMPKYVWEPQTTKLILKLSKNAKNVIFAGSFFGDQAVICASKNKKTNVHCFEPNFKQLKCLRLNKKHNDLSNLKINSDALYSRSNIALELSTPKNYANDYDDGELQVKKNYGINPKINSIRLDDYILKKRISYIDLLHMDVEGSELDILYGAKKLIKKSKIKNIIFELNSNYVNWNNGIKKIKLIKFLLNNKYKIYAIRDIHSSFDINNIPIELLPLDKVFLEGPKHGFNMIATQSKNLNCKILNKKLSPKYLPYKKSEKFHTENLHNLYKR